MKARRICVPLLFLPLACVGQTTPSVGSGAPSEAIRQRFYLAYLRNGFDLLVSLPPLGNVRQFGSTGLVQEFQDAAQTGARLALVKDMDYVPSPSDEGSPAIDVFQVRAPMYSYYSSVGPATAGYPLMDTAQCPNITDVPCQYQLFSKNYALVVYGDNYAIRDPFFTKWNSLGGIAVLGPPASAERSLTSVEGTAATVQLYAKGALFNITSGPNKGRLLVVISPIYDVYSERGGVTDVLGFPTSDELALPNGRRRQSFEGGSIEYEPGGSPYVRWPVASITVAPNSLRLKLGDTVTLTATVVTTKGERVTDRVVSWTTSNSRVASVQPAGAAVTLRAEGGGTAVITATSEGKQSLPVTVVVSAPCCQIGEGAPSLTVQQALEDAVTRNRLTIRLPAPSPAQRTGNGYVQELWSGDPATSTRYLVAKSDGSSLAYVVTGEFLQRYLELGGPAGPLGYPASDGTPGGHQLFENSSALGGSPPRLVSGAILARWAVLGYESGAAGPVLAEAVPFLTFMGTAGRMQSFRDGIILAAETGPQSGRAFFVRGPILARYLALGGPTGSMGVPLNEEFATAGIRRQDFEGGSIDYSAGAGEAVAHERERRPAVTAAPNPVLAGSRVRITVSGFANQSTLRVSVTGLPDFEVRVETGAYSWEAMVPTTARSGTVSIRAVDTGSQASAEGSYQVRAASEARLQLRKLRGDLQTGLPGALLPQALRISLRDESGSPAPSIPVRFSASPGAQVSPPSAVTDEKGEAEAALRLPPSEGVALVTVEAARQVATFSALATASALSNFPAYLQTGNVPLGPGPATIAQKGALLAAVASIIRYHQDRGDLSSANGLADPVSLNRFLTDFCTFDAQGVEICDGFIAAPDSGEPVVNLWRLAGFVGGNLDVSAERTDAASVRDLLALGSPVLLALSLSAGDLEAGAHFVVATGVGPGAEIRIHDPNPAFGRSVLEEYLAGFATGSQRWKGGVTAAVRLLPRGPSPAGFLITSGGIPLELSSPAGICGKSVEWPSCTAAADQVPPAAGTFRARYCDGLQPTYQLEITAAGNYQLIVTDLASMGGRFEMAGGGSSGYKITRPAGRLAVAPQDVSLAANGIVNAASFTPAIAPGSLISIFGSGLARAGAKTRVQIDGSDVPVLSAAPFQINAHVPLELPPGSHTLRIQLPYGSAERIVEVQPTAPAIFFLDSSRPAIVNQDGALNSPGNPARRGQVLTIYCTGLGQVSASGGFQVASTPVTAVLDGSEVPVAFAGLTPGFIGLYQVNLPLPTAIPPRLDTHVMLKQGATVSNRAPLAIE